jgi:hypothetical protein
LEIAEIAEIAEIKEIKEIGASLLLNTKAKLQFL